jgi:hypothetical protein
MAVTPGSPAHAGAVRLARGAPLQLDSGCVDDNGEDRERYQRRRMSFNDIADICRRKRCLGGIVRG